MRHAIHGPNWVVWNCDTLGIAHGRNTIESFGRNTWNIEGCWLNHPSPLSFISKLLNPRHLRIGYNAHEHVRRYFFFLPILFHNSISILKVQRFRFRWNEDERNSIFSLHSNQGIFIGLNASFKRVMVGWGTDWNWDARCNWEKNKFRHWASTRIDDEWKRRK